MKPEAVFFDCDGVISDNEKDGHQVAFNQAFKEKRLRVFWDDQLYAELLKVGGGKERLKYFFETFGWPLSISDRPAFIRTLHELKSKIYVDLIKGRKLKLRPGVERFMNELISQNIPIGICSTSRKESLLTLLRNLLGEHLLSQISIILAGDDVKYKKPDPEIYKLAAEKLKVHPPNCWVVEDSEIGMRAAKDAGMKVIITTSFYGKNESFKKADWVSDELGVTTLKDLMNDL